MQNYSGRICKVQNPQRKTPVCMINVALPLQHQVWRYERYANQTFHCLTPIPSILAGKYVQAYRHCSQDIKVAENEVTNVTSTLLWQQINYSTVLKFLSPTNAPLNYTYKILKHTARLSHDCSYMFRSTWTIIRQPMPNLAKVTILSK